MSASILTTHEWMEQRKLAINALMSREGPSEEEKTEVGLRLRLARVALGWDTREKSQRQYAEIGGLESNTYNQYEKGVNYPRAEYLLKLCHEHGLTLDYIYRGKFAGLSYDIEKKIRAEHAKHAEAQTAAIKVVPLNPHRRQTA